MKLKDITWKDGRFSTVYGYIGDLQVAVICYTITSGNPKPWLLRVSMFDRESRTDYVTVPDAKVAASDILMGMLRRVVDE